MTHSPDPPRGARPTAAALALLACTACASAGRAVPVADEGEPEEAPPLVRFRYPIEISHADFDLGSGEALDSLTALAVVPTAEVWLPVDEHWTVIPFAGLGGGWLLDDDVAIVLATVGARAPWIRTLGEPIALRIQPRLQYSANLNREDGLLGDWGSADLSVELRRAFGAPPDRTRFEAGVYVKGIWYWADLEFELPGITPEPVARQLELGVSLGTREPLKVLGFDLPRVFLGYRFGEDLDVVGVRFGEL